VHRAAGPLALDVIVNLEPSDLALLLVGPKVHRMAPLLEMRGFSCEAHAGAHDGLVALSRRAFDVVLLELDLEGKDVRVFLDDARVLQPAARFLMLDDPSRSHLLVATWVRGLHAYVATPPQERVLMQTLLAEGQIAQWLKRAPAAGDASRLAALEQEVRSLRDALVLEKQRNAAAEEATQTWAPGRAPAAHPALHSADSDDGFEERTVASRFEDSASFSEGTGAALIAAALDEVDDAWGEASALIAAALADVEDPRPGAAEEPASDIFDPEDNPWEDEATLAQPMPPRPEAPKRSVDTAVDLHIDLDFDDL
jgi:DNA-binding NarL/FixJ family response regulator